MIVRQYCIKRAEFRKLFGSIRFRLKGSRGYKLTEEACKRFDISNL